MLFKKISKKLRKDFLNFLKKYYFLVLAFFFILTVFLGFRAFQINLKTDFMDLLSDKSKYIQNINTAIDYYGSAGYLIGVLEWNSNYKETLSWLKSLKTETALVYSEIQDALTRNDAQRLLTWFSNDGEIKTNALIHFYKTIKENLKEEVAKNPDEKYLNLLDQEMKIIIQETAEKWERFKKDLKNREEGYAFLYGLEDNQYAFNHYTQTILLKKGGKKILERFAGELTSKLEQEKKIVKYVEYKFQTNFIKDNLLYFLEEEDLLEIKERISKKINYERRKKIISSALLEDQPVSLDFKDIEEKYKDGPKVFKITRQRDFLEKSKNSFDYYMNKNEDTLLVFIKPADGPNNLQFAKKLYDRTKNITNSLLLKYPKGLSVGFTGQHFQKIEDSKIIQSDLTLVLWLSLGLILLFIYLSFRNFRSIFSIGITLIAGLICFVGFVELAIGSFNIVSGFLIAILAGLGVDSAVTLFYRYVEERKRGRDVYGALEIVFNTAFMSIFTSVFTITAAFFILTISDFKGFSQFGLAAGTGMIILLIVFVFVFPSMLILSEKIRPMKIRKNITHIESARGKRFPFYRLIFFLAFAFTVFSLIVLPRVKFNANFNELSSVSSEARKYEKKAEALIQMDLKPVAFYAQDWETMKNLTKKIIDLKNQGQLPTMDKVDSYYNYFPENQNEKKAIMAQIKTLLSDSVLSKLKNKEEKQKVGRLKELVDAPKVGVKDIPDEIRRQFIGRMSGYFVFCYPKSGLVLSSPSTIQEIAADLQKINPAGENSKILTASQNLVFNDTLHMIKKEAPFILGLLFLTIFIILWLDLKSVKFVFIALIPLVIGFLWIFGAAFLLKIKLNYFNVMISPIIMGISINYGVQILHRYREEGAENLLFIFKTTGTSVYMSALTDAAGFCALIFALYRGLSSMGQLALIGIFACATVTSVLLISFLEMKKDMKRQGWKQRIWSRKRNKI